MALLVFKPFGVRGLSFVQRRDGSHRGITLSKLSGTKQPYEVKPWHVPMPGPLRPAFLFPEKCWTSRLQKPLRADEPVMQNDELGPRRVATCNRASAAGIETRVRFECGLAARRAGFS